MAKQIKEFSSNTGAKERAVRIRLAKLRNQKKDTSNEVFEVEIINANLWYSESKNVTFTVREYSGEYYQLIDSDMQGISKLILKKDAKKCILNDGYVCKQ